MAEIEPNKPTPPVSQNMSDALRQITSGWLSKIELAKQSKKHFNDVSEQCSAFFQASVSFMWEPDFRRKFLGTEVSPNFHVTLNKAFELVSIYGPTLYWQNPQRMLNARKHVPVIPEMFGVDQQQQQELQEQQKKVQEQLQQAQQQLQQIQQQTQQQLQQAQQQGMDPASAQQMAMQQSPQLMQAQQQIQPLTMQMQQIQMQLQQQEEAQKQFQRATSKQQQENSKRSVRAELMQGVAELHSN